ncbi:hypothetical protein SAMN06296386_11431 [Lachnospiraceae bacterium]|nr:hypothetical protein SAMN06296386_11431 [Lachnospiraceae bacterium]
MFKSRMENKKFRGVLFAVLFVIILVVLSIAVKPDYGEVYNIVQVKQKLQSFSKEKENTIDVIFAGNSEVYSTFSPLQLYMEQGISSYCMSESALRLCDALELTKAAFETQEPKVVVLEADAIFSDADPHKDNYALPTNLIEDIFPIFHYHIFYKSFTTSEWRRKDPDLRIEHPLRGFIKTDLAVPYTGPADYMNREENISIGDDSMEYLEKFRIFCEEKKVPLVLTAAPTPGSWTWARHNILQEYADAHDIPFVDMNLHLEEMEIDWNKDTMDGGNHLSFSGSKKASSFMGKYLMENYRLPNHYGEEAYADWLKDNEEFEVYE